MSALPPPDPNFGEKAVLLLISFVLLYILGLEFLNFLTFY